MTDTTDDGYISSIEYIRNLRFDYIEIYSLQRGEAFESSQRQARKEYEQLSTRKDKNKLDQEESINYETLHKRLGRVQYLLDEEGHFHSSAERTHTFQRNDEAVQKLLGILNTEIRDIPYFLCAPTYRDAIVFYDQQQHMVSVLNICLGCQYMATGPAQDISADFETYDLLKKFFIEIGHKVERPDYFVLDSLRKGRQE